MFAHEKYCSRTKRSRFSWKYMADMSKCATYAIIFKKTSFTDVLVNIRYEIFTMEQKHLDLTTDVDFLW